jgi:uracil phosphoribosyltransferase
MAAMAMSLRVVVPPHPLIAHWLTLARDADTPSPLFATAMTELGRWLTYEALRDWLPQQTVRVTTPLAETEGTIIDGTVPLLVIPVLRGGLGLWQGGQTVVPAARVAHVGLDTGGGEVHWYLDDLPAHLEDRLGVLVFLPVLASGRTLVALVNRLQKLGVMGPRLRVVTALAAAPGLREVGEQIADLTIYCGCIDAELDALGQVKPGFGDAAQRLYGNPAPLI